MLFSTTGKSLVQFICSNTAQPTGKVLTIALRSLASGSAKPKIREQTDDYIDERPETRIIPETHKTGTELDFNFIDITSTSGTFYHAPTQQKNAGKLVKFSVGYIDTAPDAPKGTPTVLALHGTPGRSVQFKEVIEKLSKENVRVVAPDFPGWGCTSFDYKSSWKHTPEERGNFVIDFLDALNINRIDVLLPHSSAFYPSLLLSNVLESIKSIVFLNPTIHKHISAYKPLWLANTIITMTRNPALRPAALALANALANRSSNKKASLEKAKPENLIMAGETLLAANLKVVPGQLKTLLNARNIPISLYVSQNDPLIRLQGSLEMANYLGFKEENFSVIGKDGQVKRQGKQHYQQNRFLEANILEFGTHVGMRKYPEHVAKSVINVLGHLRS